jgi:hypothetical protein
MQFILLLDEVGAEFTQARINRKEMVAAVYGCLVRERPLAIKPVEVIQPSDKAGRAAGGFLLLGPLGAALGVLTGKGPAVRIELQFAETVRQGLIAQRDYARFRQKVERMQAYRSGDLGKTIAGWTGTGLLALVLGAAIGPVGLLVAGGIAFTVNLALTRRREKRA